MSVCVLYYTCTCLQVVVANLLQTRRAAVTIVTAEGEEEVKKENEVEIESVLVDKIVTLHSSYVAQCQTS